MDTSQITRSELALLVSVGAVSLADLIDDRDAMDKLLSHTNAGGILEDAISRDPFAARALVDDAEFAKRTVGSVPVAVVVASRLPRIAFAGLMHNPRLAREVPGFAVEIARDAEAAAWMSANEALMNLLQPGDRILVRARAAETQKTDAVRGGVPAVQAAPAPARSLR
jgi:hypothetical protein